jgi:outer membrane protein insertion porin family
MRISIKIFRLILINSLFLSGAFAGPVPADKWKIVSVDFSGNNHFTGRRLNRVIISRPSALFRPSYFHSAIFQDDLRALRRFYQRNGYLEASIVEHRIQKDSLKKEVRIFILLEEGEQTFVEGTEIFGNRDFSDSLLVQLIVLRTGAPLREEYIDRTLQNFTKFYTDRGYLEAEIDPDIRINPQSHRAVISFHILEKTPFTVGRIVLQGLEKTRSAVARKEIQFKEGETINYSKILESQRRLYLTGLFNSVYIRPVSASHDSTRKDLFIDMKENPSIELNLTAGYGSLEKIRCQAEIFNANLFGTGRKIGFRGKISFIERGAELSFTDPWTLGSPWRTDTQFMINYKVEPGYHFSSREVKIIFGRQFMRRTQLTASLRIQSGRLSDLKTQDIPDNLESRLRSLRVSFLHDTRDNLFDPSHGWYYEWSNEFGQTKSESRKGFWRTAIQLKRFQSLGLHTVLGTGWEAGFIHIPGGRQSLPLQERFYTGGPNSIRGFPYQMVGPLDVNNIPTGGTIKLNWHVIEIRRSIYRNTLGIAFFADMGGLWENPKSVRFSQIRFSPGAGVRLKTPLGAVRLDWGWNIFPKNDEARYQWIFSMGQAF